MNDKDSIYSITPDFNMVLSETEAAFIQDENSIGAKKYTEEFHMEDKTELVKKIYQKSVILCLNLPSTIIVTIYLYETQETSHF